MKEKNHKQDIHSVYFLGIMLVIFWPLSVYYFIKDNKKLKKRGFERNWGFSLVYWLLACTMAVFMPFFWFCVYVVYLR